MDHLEYYHVVTERPMELGQTLFLDLEHPNGVYRRVMEQKKTVEEIYAHPHLWSIETLEHHTKVAIRELAMEQVRRRSFPHLPSRMGCLYVSQTLQEAQRWAGWFIDWGRPTYHIVKLRAHESCFAGDANNCFDPVFDEEKNYALAEHYWNNLPNGKGFAPIREVLVSGRIEVVEIVQTINRNL